MKLRNKETGEIVDFGYLQSDYIAPLVLTTHVNDKPEMYRYNSLAELNEEWEDYEEPDEYWFIDFNGEIKEFEVLGFEWQGWMKEIGNYFSSREEAEKAVEKLKAVKRLKDKGFKLKGWYMPKNTLNIEIDGGFPKDVSLCDVMDDLDIVFGGEE